MAHPEIKVARESKGHAAHVEYSIPPVRKSLCELYPASLIHHYCASLIRQVRTIGIPTEISGEVYGMQAEIKAY